MPYCQYATLKSEHNASRTKFTLTDNPRRKGEQGIRIEQSSPSPGPQYIVAEQTHKNYQRYLVAGSYWA